MSVKTLITQEPRYLCEPTHSNLVQMQSSASYFFSRNYFPRCICPIWQKLIRGVFQSSPTQSYAKLRREHFRLCFDRRQVRLEPQRRPSEVEHLGTKKSVGSCF